MDSCFDGAEAYEYIKSGEFDVVVSDIMMPKLDGVSFIALAAGLIFAIVFKEKLKRR